MAVQTNTAMFWFRFLQTGLRPTAYGRSARPGCLLVPVLTDGLRPARPTRPYFGSVGFLQTGYGRPSNPAVLWYRLLQTGYGRPARPGRNLVLVLTNRLRPARPTRSCFNRLRPARPTGRISVPVLTNRLRPACPDPVTGYGRPARPGRISVPVLTAVFRYWFLQPGYGRPARPGRALTGYGRPARPGRISTGYGRVTAVSSGPGRVGSETAIPNLTLNA
ncbi:hypothetical protein BC829DRAFT_445517 [Chytridium lagenaria]|nr:hypothetical protein BC829DRAFT_445517 [Chytridium lagenaria]